MASQGPHPFIAVRKDQGNAAVFDVWTLVHIGWGFTAGAMRMNPWLFVGLSTVYEVAEYAHEYPSGSVLFGSKRPEIGTNMVADLGVAMLGYSIGNWLSWR